MSYYYLSHRTIRHLVQNSKRNATFADVLSWMSNATEYDELPVRHNEDLINAELSKNLPLPASSFDNLPMWDPMSKPSFSFKPTCPVSICLSQITLETKPVFLTRRYVIIQASIDVLTELGYLSSCLQMISLLQCIKSARWPADYRYQSFRAYPLRHLQNKLFLTVFKILRYSQNTTTSVLYRVSEFHHISYLVSTKPQA